MQSDFMDWLGQQQGRAYDLHEQHVNPIFVKMLRTIGFDKAYVKGEGCYLWDADGTKYLDLLTGWGVFALGRNHPKIKTIMQDIIAQDLPNLVRMDCGLLSGLVAEKLTSHLPDSLSRVFFCNSGTESIETAIKFAPLRDGPAGNCLLRSRLSWIDHGRAVAERRGFLSRAVRPADAGDE